MSNVNDSENLNNTDSTLNEDSQGNVIDKAIDASDRVDRGKKALEGAKNLRNQRRASKAASKAAGKTAGKVATKGVGIMPIALTIIGIVFLILMVSGIIIFLIYLPGSLIAKFKGFLKSLTKYFYGEYVAVNNDDILKAANYIQDRGYDLYAEGYINEKINKETDLDENGKIINLPGGVSVGHLLELYARMDAYTYGIRNRTLVSKIHDKMTLGIMNAPLMEDMAGFISLKKGTFSDNEQIEESEFKNGIFKNIAKVDRESETLTINKIGGKYNFQMDGWSGRYGMPLDLFMALHQGTRAPDLVKEIARGTTTYTDSSFKNPVYKYTPEQKVYYKKPILNILMLETKVTNEVNFVVPTSTLLNGEVYVLKGELDFGILHDKNPFEGLTESDFDVKSVVSQDEIYKSFFKAHDGRFIRISPKYPGAVVSYQQPSSRDRSGIPIVNPVQWEEVDDNSPFLKQEHERGLEEQHEDYEREKGYRIQEEAYDFSAIFFELVDGKYRVKNAVNEIAKIEKSSNLTGFTDQYALYDFVEEVVKGQKDSGVSKINNSKNFDKAIVDLKSYVGTTKTYIPIIKNSEGHWFRDVYFYLNKGEEYIVEDTDYFLTTGEKWAKYNISEEEGQKILTPETAKLETEEWNAYEVKTTDNRGALGQKIILDDNKYEGIEEHVYLNESQTITPKQKEEGRRGMTNPRTKSLFVDGEWYKYDGSETRADENNADKKKILANRDEILKSKIEADNDLIAAFEILEGSKTLDSQYILRDLKELYVELGYFEKEDLRDPIRRILRWPLVQYKTPGMWPAADIHQDPEGYGVYIPSKTTLEEIYDEDTLSENTQVVGEGFEAEEVDVVSPVTGRIEEIGTKTVKRLVADDKGDLVTIEYEDVGYITISAIDNTAPSEADPYRVFYDTEYKGVIAGKVKHGKQADDSRYIEGNKITIEGITVEIPTDVDDPSNSKYIKQLKSSDIKKVQSKKTREEAERIEEEKKNAPNYIAVSGSEGHIGDYIKEGTIIGKTTESDIKIVMQDVDKAFIENTDQYIVLSSGTYLQLMDDYYTKVEDGEPNFVDDIELFKQMFSGYPYIQENAQAFLDMQDEFEVNAIFAAAVTIAECSGGNATKGLNYDIKQKYGGEHNNIFSIKGNTTDLEHFKDYGEGACHWEVYTDALDATRAFGSRISNHPTGIYYWKANDYYVSEIALDYCNVEWGVNVNRHMSTAIQKGMQALGIDIPETPTGANFEIPSGPGVPMVLKATAYCACAKCCGIWADANATTSSGVSARAYHTLAADPKVLPMGTIVYLEYFKNAPNGGWFRVEDTGGSIKNNRIDIFYNSHQEALVFGVQTLNALVYRP